MDVHLWPLWEKEVHDILHPLFKELQLIFLAYTRSISEDSAEDAMEMSMDEFHDFVVDVGLETKQYKFDVMCNQFIKANATNVAQVREQRQEEKRDAQSRGNDAARTGEARAGARQDQGHVGRRGGQEGPGAGALRVPQHARAHRLLARQPELWALGGQGQDGEGQEELVPVPFALSVMLNEIILPRAKRENSAAFREKEMKDPSVAGARRRCARGSRSGTSTSSRARLSVDQDDKLLRRVARALRRPHAPTAERPNTDLYAAWTVVHTCA